MSIQYPLGAAPMAAPGGLRPWVAGWAPGAASLPLGSPVEPLVSPLAGAPAWTSPGLLPVQSPPPQPYFEACGGCCGAANRQLSPLPGVAALGMPPHSLCQQPPAMLSARPLASPLQQHGGGGGLQLASSPRLVGSPPAGAYGGGGSLMAPVAVPPALLSRIDGVVSEMERELCDDAAMCVASPLREASAPPDPHGGAFGRPPVHVATGPENALSQDYGGQGHQALKWINSQIGAIERRREACDMRSAHLAQLRQLVGSQRKPWEQHALGARGSEGSTAGSNDHEPRLSASGSEEDFGNAAMVEYNPHRRGGADAGDRIKTLGAHHYILRKQVEDLHHSHAEKDRQLLLSSQERQELIDAHGALEATCERRLQELWTAAEAVEEGGRRAELAEEAASERVKQAAAETHGLQARMLQLEKEVVSEQQLAAEAVAAREAVEVDLKDLELNSQAVLEDCRRLNKRVEELQGTGGGGAGSGAVLTTPMSPSSAQVHEERKVLDQHVKMLEDQRCELEAFRRALADESRSLSKQYSARDEQTKRELHSLSKAHKQLREEYMQKEEFLLTIEARSDAAEDSLASEYSAWRADRERLQQLERELADAGGAAAALEASVHRVDSDRARIVELEKELTDALASQEAQSRQLQQQRGKVLELEQELAEKHSAVESHLRADAASKATIDDLREQLHDSRRRGDEHEERHVTNRSLIGELERQLQEAQEALDDHSERHHELSAEVLGVRRQLTDTEAAREHHAQQHLTKQSRLSDLEQQLAQALASQDHHQKNHGAMQVRLSQLSAEITEAMAEKDHHVKQTSSHKGKVSELERQLAEALEHKDQFSRQHAAVKTKHDQLVDQVAELLDARDSHGKAVTNFKRQIMELEDHLAEHEAEAEQSRKHHGASKGRVQELERLIQEMEAEAHAEKSAHNKAASALQANILELEVKLVEAERQREQQAKQQRELQARFVELEQHLHEVQAEKETRARSYSALRSKMNEMEHELAEAQETKQQHSRRHTIAQTQLKSIEEELGGALGEKERQVKQQTARIKELEDMLDAAMGEKESHAKQTHRRHEELERLLSATQNEKDHHSRKHGDALSRIEELESELSSALKEKSGHADTLHTTRERLKELEARHSGVLDEHHQKHTTSQARISELEEELLRSLRDRDHHATKHSSLESRYRELEERFEARGGAEEATVQVLALEDRLGVAERERDDLFADRESLQAQVRELVEELHRAKEDRDEQQRQRGLSDMRIESLDRSLRERSLQDAQEVDSNLQRVVEQDRTIADLEARLLASSEARHGTTRELERKVEHLEKELHEARRTLAHEHTLAETIRKDAEKALEQADEAKRAQAQEYEERLNLALEGRTKVAFEGLPYSHGRSNSFQHSRTAERPGRVQRSLTAGSVDSELDLPFDRFESRASSAVGQRTSTRNFPIPDWLPAAAVQILEQIETQGWETVNWRHDHTLLHLAAEHGDHKLCTHLVTLDADPNAMDDKGRTPVDCAREHGHADCARAIEEMMSGRQERFRTSLKEEPERIRPVIPSSYLKIMAQIDRIGWHKMQWTRGFTLLHWAAKHDYPELCGRFLTQGADPYHRDDSGKSAFDFARERGSLRAERELELPVKSELVPLEDLSEFYQLGNEEDSLAPLESGQFRHKSLAAQPRASVLAARPSLAF
eukprot:TRINITY_DN100548_c0_g1_i1.p1 TRINITY_DN100548_c0_g1~~TRINITY_DN100548_c0_g1_i1.p1  ORF type:complete len:1674 (+),score=540.89 TRINITY_DN100548_c0_g1_i1:94-5115(+)